MVSYIEYYIFIVLYVTPSTREAISARRAIFDGDSEDEWVGPRPFTLLVARRDKSLTRVSENF